MSDTITIAGHPFTVPVRYSEGHELTANEASALNQTYHENLRNNFAKQVKEGVEAGVGLDVLQAKLNDYAENYQFGFRTAGVGATRDPVQSEAKRIARSVITTALKKKGKKVADIEASAISAAVEKLLADPARGPAIMAQAKERVAEAQAAAGADLSDIIADMPNKPVEPAKAA